MNNDICRVTGAEFPLFAFTHCRDVAAAVSRAGGFGVLGAATFTPEQLRIELDWLHAHVGGRPYGVDVLLPAQQAAESGMSLADLQAMIPKRHVGFVVDLLGQHGILLDPADAVSQDVQPLMPDVGEQLLDVALEYPIKLIVNALGPAPASMIERAHAKGIAVGALVGNKEHAVRQVQAGIDVLVAQGTEAGGHCGDVSTLVLIPEVLRAIHSVRDVPVLAAGGIMTGEQMAACMAMGAQGVWTGSVWLAASEADTSAVFQEKMVAASSRDTVRSKARTGKYSRQLHSPWHDAWDAEGAPPPLALPLMGMISEPAFATIERAAQRGSPGARALSSYFVGQGVGLVETVRPTAAIVRSFREEFAEAVAALNCAIE